MKTRDSYDVVSGIGGHQPAGISPSEGDWTCISDGLDGDGAKIANNTAVDWSPSSWRTKPVRQIPVWPDADTAVGVERQLATFPPLVFAGEVDRLTERLALVASGKAILLQGGDCAESFVEHGAENIRDFLSVFLQMSAVLTYASGLPVVKVGRIAGQFAKPRSEDSETVDGITLPSYRGDIVNGVEFSETARRPDATRQIEAYRQSAATLNLIRALCVGGYADLRNVHGWIRKFVTDSPAVAKYVSIADDIAKALSFVEAAGITSHNSPQLASVTMYTSHEALLLGYEEAMTRRDSRTGKWYATSGHMVWIGDRTRQHDGAHVEFCRGIENPIGIKCGPSLDPDDLLRLISILNPTQRAGRITLICRMGADKVAGSLPPLVRAVKSSGMPVVWSCDPMHGNTEKTASGYKTRRLDNVIREMDDFVAVHKAESTWSGGVHLEMTGRDVTECIGGTSQVGEHNIGSRYHTHCDPRLNANQALGVIFDLAEKVSRR